MNLNPLRLFRRGSGPTPGEATAAQARPGPLAGIAGFSNAMGGGFDPPQPGTYDVYRQICAHPTVALALAIVTTPVATAGRRWEKRDAGVPDDRLAAVRSVFDPLWRDAVRGCLLAVRLGWTPFEQVWGREGKLIVPVRLKPLLPDHTDPLVDAHGNVIGVRNHPGNAEPVELTGAKAFVFTYDPQWGDPHGRARLENIRDSWSQAVQFAQRLAQFYRKAVGVVLQLHYPDGTSRDASGAERPNDQIAQQILDAVAAGKSVRFPNLFAATDDMQAAAEMAGKSQWLLSTLAVAAGDHAAGILAGMERMDSMIFAGLLRSPRTGLESKNGSRADAQQHTDTGTQDAQMLADDIFRALSHGPVDDMLVANWGESARGSVWCEAEPIESDRQQTLTTLLQAMLSNPDVAPDIAQRIDRPRMLEELDLPVLPDATGGGVPEGGELLQVPGGDAGSDEPGPAAATGRKTKQLSRATRSKPASPAPAVPAWADEW